MSTKDCGDGLFGSCARTVSGDAGTGMPKMCFSRCGTVSNSACGIMKRFGQDAARHVRHEFGAAFQSLDGMGDPLGPVSGGAGLSGCCRSCSALREPGSLVPWIPRIGRGARRSAIAFTMVPGVITMVAQLGFRKYYNLIMIGIFYVTPLLNIVAPDNHVEILRPFLPRASCAGRYFYRKPCRSHRRSWPRLALAWRRSRTTAGP